MDRFFSERFLFDTSQYNIRKYKILDFHSFYQNLQFPDKNTIIALELLALFLMISSMIKGWLIFTKILKVYHTSSKVKWTPTVCMVHYRNGQTWHDRA